MVVGPKIQKQETVSMLSLFSVNHSECVSELLSMSVMTTMTVMTVATVTAVTTPAFYHLKNNVVKLLDVLCLYLTFLI